MEKVEHGAGFCPNTGAVSLGIVVRDMVGRLLISSWRTLNHIASPAEAEAVACLEGTRLPTEWVRLLVLVETDCHTLGPGLAY
jgi:hypothetical protein